MPLTPRHTADPKNETIKAVFDELSKLATEANPHGEAIVECAYSGDIIFFVEVSREILTEIDLKSVADGEKTAKDFAEEFFSKTMTFDMARRRKALENK